MQDLGFKAEATPVDNAIMWQGVAQGSFDAMVSAWLPGTHGDLYDKVKDKIDDKVEVFLFFVSNLQYYNSLYF